MQPGGQDVIEAVSGDDLDVVDGDQVAVGDDTDPSDPEAPVDARLRRQASRPAPRSKSS